MSMGPYEENIINVPEPDKRFVWPGTEEATLKLTHENVGIAGGHACAHSSPVCLYVMFVVKCKYILCEYYVHEFTQERGGWTVRLSMVLL